ncbi:MAG: cysteine desulfurase CsdA [Verrucomicrobiales bacterium]|nr:cysteine desulfurase CsdA [Verrucomicrobiales bacterium]|tara:strand:- start:10463 stop:11683 length:1221 start_codon:yes stop_codon:yes gene_type:complete
MAPFEIDNIRADFPILSKEVEGKPLTYLDNGATAQKPSAVINSMSKFYAESNANIHRGIHHLSREATEAYEKSRSEIKAALQLPDSHELIFVRGATEGINLVTHGLEDRLQEGDEVVLTIMEHHANFVPWQILQERKNIKVHVVGLNESGELDLEAWKAAFNEKTRVAAFTHVSNVLGTVNPVSEMTTFAREREVITLVDGAQALPHGPVDLREVGGDFYVFSGHKVFGPDGIGVLTGPRDLLNSFRPYQSGGDMIERVQVSGTTFRDVPERFEAGTPNISATLGLAEAFRYMASIDWKAANAHENSLAEQTTEQLKGLGGIRIFGESTGKTAIVSFLFDIAHPQDIGTILDTEGVAIRIGHHCAQPLMDYYEVPATVRASFAFYNNEADVEAFMRGMHKVKRFFG